MSDSTTLKKRTLGSTGLEVSPLVVSSGYGLDGAGVELARERGVNFFHISGREGNGFAEAVGRAARADREGTVVSLHSYARAGGWLRRKVEKELKRLGIDRLDVVFLGYWQLAPSGWALDEARRLKERGLIGAIGVACHDRPLFAEYAARGVFDVLMVRYNAAHRGAESEVFDALAEENRPGIATYTTTRWGDLMNEKKMPGGESPPPPADCYRFAMTHEAVDAVFCAPKNSEELIPALDAMDRGPLGEEELNRMRRIGDHIHANHGKPFYEKF